MVEAEVIVHPNCATQDGDKDSIFCDFVSLGLTSASGKISGSMVTLRSRHLQAHPTDIVFILKHHATLLRLGLRG